MIFKYNIKEMVQWEKGSMSGTWVDMTILDNNLEEKDKE